MHRTARLDLPLLLPDVTDQCDACITRLLQLLERREEVVSVHVVDAGEMPDGEPPLDDGSKPAAPLGPQLCLHYDADQLTLSQVEAIARAAGAGVTDRFGHVVVPFHSVGSEDLGRRLEDALRDLRGVTVAAVNYQGQVVRVEYDKRRVDRVAIEMRLREVGAEPLAETAGQEGVPAPSAAAPTATRPAPFGDWYARNKELAWSLASGLLLTVGWAAERFADVPAALAITLYGAAYFFGARDNVGHFVADVRRGKFHFNIDLLMVVAAAGAALLGAWLEGALLLFLFSLGHALEHYAMGRARHAIAALAELAPQTAIVIRDGKELPVPIAEVRPGDRLVIKPAERIPVDGAVREGRSAVNQAPITGESVPVDKSPGERVFAGSVNGEGALVVEVTAAIGDRTLDRVIRLVGRVPLSVWGAREWLAVIRETRAKGSARNGRAACQAWFPFCHFLRMSRSAK